MRRLLLVPAFLLLLASAAAAQESSAAAPRAGRPEGDVAAPVSPVFVPAPAFRLAAPWEQPRDASSMRVAAMRAPRTETLLGAAVGLVAGAVATYVVLHGGGSNSLCDRSANQDAMNRGECAGLVALGGAVGAGLGALIGSRIGR